MARSEGGHRANTASAVDPSVVERTISRLHGFRRLRIRGKRRDDIHEPFLGLAVCLITHATSRGSVGASQTGDRSPGTTEGLRPAGTRHGGTGPNTGISVRNGDRLPPCLVPLRSRARDGRVRREGPRRHDHDDRRRWLSGHRACHGHRRRKGEELPDWKQAHNRSQNKSEHASSTYRPNEDLEDPPRMPPQGRRRPLRHARPRPRAQPQPRRTGERTNDPRPRPHESRSFTEQALQLLPTDWRDGPSGGSRWA